MLTPAAIRDRQMAPASSPRGNMDRLTCRAEFLHAASAGIKVGMPGLVLQALHRGDGAAVRFGFTATKKLGNAVARNLAKRRLREAARTAAGLVDFTGFDLVLIGRSGTGARPMPLLVQDLLDAFSRASGGSGPGRRG